MLYMLYFVMNKNSPKYIARLHSLNTFILLYFLRFQEGGLSPQIRHWANQRWEARPFCNKIYMNPDGDRPDT